MKRRQPQTVLQIERHLRSLHSLSFVQSVDVRVPDPGNADPGLDAEVRLQTPRGQFSFAAEVKRSYLDKATLNGLLVQQVHARDRLKMPLLLLARYIPPPTGESLAKAGINFVDSAGNVHLALGEDYQVSVIGRKEAKHPLAERRISAGLMQVVFACLVQESAINSSVRTLAEIAGVSKTAAAEARRRLIETGKLIQSRAGLRIADRKALEDEFIAGYQTLRSGIWVGAFRPLGHAKDAPLRSIREWADANNSIWSTTDPSYFRLTGRIAVFLSTLPDNLEADLKLAPHGNGPVTLLHSFGTLFPWRVQTGVPLAHPFLMYAELLRDADPNALKAAANVQREYLAKRSNSV